MNDNINLHYQNEKTFFLLWECVCAEKRKNINLKLYKTKVKKNFFFVGGGGGCVFGREGVGVQKNEKKQKFKITKNKVKKKLFL